MSKRLDEVMVAMQLVQSRSQAANFIQMGYVKVAGKVVKKPGMLVKKQQKIVLTTKHNYVSRAGYKLDSAARQLGISFKDEVVLDVGSSTGGFTDYALQHGAKKVIAVDVGTDQLHPSLHNLSQIELHEKTDIRDVTELSTPVSRVVIDVSFISLRKILPHVSTLISKDTLVLAMVKPQFEAGSMLKTKGVIKNDTVRRDILKQFEAWVKGGYVIVDKADSEVTGGKGNRERFYVLKKTAKQSRVRV